MQFIYVIVILGIFPLWMNSCCIIFNSLIRIILIFLYVACISIIALVAETILFYWLLIIGRYVISVCNKKMLDREQGSHHLQVIIPLKMYHVWCWLYYNFQSILKLLCWSYNVLMSLVIVWRYRIQRIGLMLKWIFNFSKSDAII